MTENEYIKAVNRAKISATISILRDLTTGSGCGVSEHEVSHIVAQLSDIEEEIFSFLNIKRL